MEFTMMEEVSDIRMRKETTIYTDLDQYEDDDVVEIKHYKKHFYNHLYYIRSEGIFVKGKTVNHIRVLRKFVNLRGYEYINVTDDIGVERKIYFKTFIPEIIENEDFGFDF